MCTLLTPPIERLILTASSFPTIRCDTLGFMRGDQDCDSTLRKSGSNIYRCINVHIYIYMYTHLTLCIDRACAFLTISFPICIYVYADMQIHATYIYIYIHTHTHNMPIHPYIQYMHTYIGTYVHTYVRMDVCMYACMYAHPFPWLIKVALIMKTSNPKSKTF